MISDLKPTGEPYSVKAGSTVRRGVVGKVPLDGNSLATYPTTSTRGHFQGWLPATNAPRCFMLRSADGGGLKHLIVGR